MWQWKFPIIIRNRIAVLRPVSSHNPDWEKLKNEARWSNRMAVFRWAKVAYNLTILTSLTEISSAEVTLYSCTWKWPFWMLVVSAAILTGVFFPQLLPKTTVKTLLLDHYWEFSNASQFIPYWSSYILTPYRLLWDTDIVCK